MSNNAYETKRETRIQNFDERAKKARLIADLLDASVEQRAKYVPLGQPILVGHHSEGKHRSYLTKINRDIQKAISLRNYANECDQKAQSAICNKSISSDDYECGNKLRAKLNERESSQERMKLINSKWRKSGEGGLRQIGLSGDELQKMLNSASSWYRKPYPSFELTNNGAEIRRLKMRIAEIDVKSVNFDKEDETDIQCGVTIIRAFSDNRLRFKFPRKPLVQVITALKSNGFKWAPSEDAWQRLLNNAAECAANQVIKAIENNQSNVDKTVLRE